MKRLFTLFALLVSGVCLAQEGEITFVVDMNNYAGGQTLGADNVYVNGVYNSWCGDCNPLTDDNGDGVYEGTYSLPLGLNEYKFTVNGWDDDEALTAGSFCTITVGENTNRLVNVTGAATLATACWAQCTTCDGAGEASGGMVTLSVDMNEYDGGQFLTPDNVSVAGSFNNWSGDANFMSDADEDGVYEITVMMEAGAQDYLFTVNNFTDTEGMSASATCVVAFGEFVNRVTVVDGDQTVPTVCWNSCDACGVVQAQDGDISLSVDMNDYSGSQDLSSSTVYVSGAFNSWCGTCDPLADDNGDGVYDAVISFPAGSQQFKFTINDWTDEENLTEAGDCTFTDGEFTNRIIEVDGDATYETTCWESCAACGESGIEEMNTISANMYPNPATDFLRIEVKEIIEVVQVLDLAGKTVISLNAVDQPTTSIDLNELSSGVYFVNVQTASGQATERIVKK